MLPIPTPVAVVAFVGCVGMLLAGLLTGVPSAALLSGTGFLGLALCLAQTMPIAARLRRERLEFAWWHGHAEESHPLGGIVVGAPFRIRCYVRNRSHRELTLSRLTAVMPPGVRSLEEAPPSLVVPPRSRVDFSLRCIALAPGRMVLQGLAVSVPGPLDLFDAPLYFPNPLATRVLPRTAALKSALASAQGLSVERVGLTPLRRSGGGTELREIREHQPGDPFNAIAWKASARMNKLMVREVEREVQQTLCLVLDVSGSMRGGAPGTRTLDRSIEVLAQAARSALERGDAVGITTVDGRVLSRVAPGEGIAQMTRIYDAMLQATEVVDRDLTSADAEEVADLVGRYMRFQEGRDFATELGWDAESMARHARRQLQRSRNQPEVVAESPTDAILRAFCRERGLALPYRPETRGFAKGEGLSRALLETAGSGRSPRALWLVSDFEGVHPREPLLRTIVSLRKRGHQTAVILPSGRPGDPVDELTLDLERVYSLEEQRRHREVRRALARLGIPVHSLGEVPPSGQTRRVA